MSPYLPMILARHELDSHHFSTSSACASLSAVAPRASVVQQSVVLRRKGQGQVLLPCLYVRSSVVHLAFQFVVAISPFSNNAVVPPVCGPILSIHLVFSSRLSFQHPNASQYSNPECDSTKRALTAWRCVIDWNSSSVFGIRALIVNTFY